MTLEPYYYDWYGGLSEALAEAHDYYSYETTNELAIDLADSSVLQDSQDPYAEDVQRIVSHAKSVESQSSNADGEGFWDDEDDDDASMTSVSDDEDENEVRIEKPIFKSDDDANSPNAIWPLTLGFSWDRGLRQWGYVMWDRERLQDMGVLNIPVYGRRQFVGSDRQASTMSLVWQSAKIRNATPLMDSTTHAS